MALITYRPMTTRQGLHTVGCLCPCSVGTGIGIRIERESGTAIGTRSAARMERTILANVSGRAAVRRGARGPVREVGKMLCHGHGLNCVTIALLLGSRDSCTCEDAACRWVRSFWVTLLRVSQPMSPTLRVDVGMYLGSLYLNLARICKRFICTAGARANPVGAIAIENGVESAGRAVTAVRATALPALLNPRMAGLSRQPSTWMRTLLRRRLP